MIYLIGGPARCGKSTLARKVRREIDGQVIAGDAFVASLQSNLRAEWVPDIYDHKVAPVVKVHGHEAKINRLRQRDEMMWQFYEAYIKAAAADSPQDDLLLEGNIWPDSLKYFSLSHRAVFLVDTTPNQADRLMAIRDSKTNDNNWMQDYSDERIAEWALFNIARSERYIALCRQYDYVYFDINDGGMGIAQREAFEYLLSKAV